MIGRLPCRRHRARDHQILAHIPPMIHPREHDIRLNAQTEQSHPHTIRRRPMHRVAALTALLDLQWLMRRHPVSALRLLPRWSHH